MIIQSLRAKGMVFKSVIDFNDKGENLLTDRKNGVTLSMTDYRIGLKLNFIFLPWELLMSLPFELNELAFGQGIAKLMENLGLNHIHHTSNLSEAIKEIGQKIKL